MADAAVEVRRLTRADAYRLARLELDAHAAGHHHGELLAGVADVIIELAHFAGKDARVQWRHAALREITGDGVVLVAPGVVTGSVIDTGLHERLQSRQRSDGRQWAEQLGDIHLQGAGGGGQLVIAHRDLCQLHLRQGGNRHPRQVGELFQGQLLLLANRPQARTDFVSIQLLGFG